MWKYTAPNRLATSRNLYFAKHKKNNEMGQLDFIHKSLFNFNLSDIETGLKIATGIRGLGPAGGSGLLAILFPSHFGTIDQFVLLGLQTLPEYKNSRELARIKNPKMLSIKDGVYLIQQKRCGD